MPSSKRSVFLFGFGGNILDRSSARNSPIRIVASVGRLCGSLCVRKIRVAPFKWLHHGPFSVLEGRRSLISDGSAMSDGAFFRFGGGVVFPFSMAVKTFYQSYFSKRWQLKFLTPALEGS